MIQMLNCWTVSVSILINVTVISCILASTSFLLPSFLSSFLANCFPASFQPETNITNTIMHMNDFLSNFPGYCVEVKSELEPAQSLDILSDMDMIGAHRRRSNTAQRLERLKKERRNQAKIKVIQWKDNTNAVLSGTYN